MELTCEHNLSPEEMLKALHGLSEAEGISEELTKALRSSSIDLSPKVPKQPALHHVYFMLMQEFEKAAKDIERYAKELIDR